MKFQRSSGILLHPTSLPGPFGIGDLGPGAYRFADFLHTAGQKIWQVLPLGPTGYGDSPYQLFSAFAGNPLLISLERLVEEGVLSKADIAGAPAFPADSVDFGAVIDFKLPLLAKAAARFHTEASGSERRRYDEFCAGHAWLEDFALFMAVKAAHGGIVWSRWEPGIASRRHDAVARWSAELEAGISAWKYMQFAFFSQWAALHRYCRERGLRIMGDIPIYVAHDSADVWANPRLFQLGPEGHPLFVAGVPPDYFSATGQLWGNPIYRWDVMARTGYRWWIERLRATFTVVDIARLDHFRGFEAYWQVPASEPTAVHGEWVKGPGEAFFEAAEGALGELPLVAENLGVITPAVESIRERFGFPGMSILQFGFGTDPQAPDFRPHNYPRNRAAYTGTHDNDTTAGWWTSAGIGDSTRSESEIRAEREFTLKYLGTDGREIHWDFIRAVEASVADIALIPMQDVLGLGSEARMNIPARPSGNWRWRCRREQITGAVRDRLREMALLYDR